MAVSVQTSPPLPPHHGDPAQAGHALAHSREVVEQRRRAVLLPEALDLLDDFRHRLQQSGENCLQGTTGTHTVFRATPGRAVQP